MYLNPRYGALSGATCSLAEAKIDFTLEDAYLNSRIHELRNRNSPGTGISSWKITLDKNVLSDFPEWSMTLAEKPQAFALKLDAECAVLWGSDRDGLVHGLAAIEMLQDAGELRYGAVGDIPRLPFRGYRVFLPSREGLLNFKAMVDQILVYYRYNRLLIEVGGAMEYKKHPEINENWVRFCADMNEYNGKSDVIQHKTFPWSKNAIHKDNGEGGFLTQEEVRDLVEYCRDRGIEVIPEVPCLSHADYIVQAHPEINERVEDPYPDTYCPSNPKSYEILFSLLDEILDVFHPRMVHIGHDEIVTLGVCPVCRQKDPQQLLLDDITRIMDYLRSKDVETICYADKFINLKGEDGNTYIDDAGKSCGGGQGYYPGHPRYVPATYPLIDRLPKDIIIADWYWGNSPEYDEKFLSLYRMFFANFAGMRFENFSERVEKGVFGCSLSNWGSLLYPLMQRNMQLLDLIFSAYLLWEPEYKDSEYNTLFNATIDATCAYYRRNELGNGSVLTITHTCRLEMPYISFVDGIYPDVLAEHLGDLVLTYQDGAEETVPVQYGDCIAGDNIPLEGAPAGMAQTIGAARPFVEDGITWYRWSFASPREEKPVAIKYRPEKDAGYRIRDWNWEA